MGDDAKRDRGGKVLATNRKAFHDYAILSRIEVGIVLAGTEVKVIRNGGVGLTGAYVSVGGDGGLWLMQANFPGYEFGNRFNHEALRPRRLLAHKKEILRLQAQQEQKGMALVPLRLYVAPNGRIKLEVGVARGKRQSDKRETIRRREADREARRAMSAARRWR